MEGRNKWMAGIDRRDGCTNPMFVSHGEIVDGWVNNSTAVVIFENKIMPQHSRQC